MPTVFGLRLRDIVATPAHLKLDADPIKLPKTSTRSSHSTSGKAQSVRSEGRLKRMVKLVKPRSSTSDMDMAEERRRIVEQRIQDLSVLLEASDTNTNIAVQSEQNTNDDHRPQRYRRRKALSNLGFGRPTTTSVARVDH